ncbi:hypothetical protein [Bradyrhizobium pachyrhizi]|uniref:hypothetical protein n=1 Tax=Bradyrhizobium pachyrhizi TaxID=280333 RepID=UPI003D367303
MFGDGASYTSGDSVRLNWPHLHFRPVSGAPPMPFEIAWSRHPAHSRWRKHQDGMVIECALTERAIVGDQPAIKMVCRLASIPEDRVDDIGERDRFWHQVRARIGRLHRLTARDRDEIEQQLAWKVPRPLPASVRQAAE